MSTVEEQFAMLQDARKYARKAMVWAGIAKAPQPEGVGRNELETYHMAAYLAGSRMPEFDPSIALDPFIKLSKELGFTARGDSELFPYQTHNIDPEVRTYFRERFRVKFTPTGELYSASAKSQHYKLDLDFGMFDTSAEMQAVLFYEMKRQRAAELQWREQELIEVNKRRAAHDVEPIVVPWVESVLNR